MHQHWETCGSYPMLCPNECTSVKFERRLLEHHLNEDCPMILVKCNICDCELPRQQMASHMQEHFTTESNVIYFGYGINATASLDSMLETEITIKRKLQEEIKDIMEESKQIRKKISTLESNREYEVLGLKEKLQVTNQQIEEYRNRISQKESEINRMSEESARTLAQRDVALQI